MKKIFLLLLTSFSLYNCTAQEKSVKPKLVVGIVVDQMRYDYLTKFENHYGDGGFMRLINDGFNAKNNHYNYVPTATGPGHASIYTGTPPKYHGIIGNSWYDKKNKKSVYCAGDDSYESVGTKSDAGKMSPHRMLTTTFTDENRLHTQFKGKTIGISIKDRGAVLPAGHTGNAAYWFEGGKDGNWITSSFYRKELPKWAKEFNKSDITKSYVKEWNTLYDIDTYVESGDDENNFEGGFKGKKKATFPYDLKKLKKENGDYSILKATPFGNSLVVDFAMEAVKKVELGKDNFTDVLAVSFSSPDYVGHNFGVNSKEVQDTYIRLDKDLERFLNFLDKEVGKGNYTVFLTADHGAIDVPSYLMSKNIPAGYFNGKEFNNKLSDFSKDQFGENLIEKISYGDIFLDKEKIKDLNLNQQEVKQILVDEIISYKHIYKVFTSDEIKNHSQSTGIEMLLHNGYNQKKSGDVLFVLEPAVISYGKTGSSHGTGYNFDTHIPLLLYGAGIKPGETYNKTQIVDIAPTMSALLGIAFPNGNTGSVVSEALK